LLGEKRLVTSLDVNSLIDFKQALNKVRAVINRSDKDYLSSLDADIQVLPTGSHFPIDPINQQDLSINATIVANQASSKEHDTLKAQE
jgi:hypothetical protein